MLRVAAIFALSLACFCAAWGAGPVSELNVLHGAVQADGFTRALGPREFQFPQDHGPHPAFRHEWWYVTGNLDSATGERFGFELTFFRVALAPPPPATVGGTAATSANGTGGATGAGAIDASHWRTRQIYLAHFAITDVARGDFRFAQKFSRDALGLTGAQADPFRVWLDDWTLGVADAHAVAGAGAKADWRLHARGQGYELTLDAQPLMQPVLNGVRGLSRKSDEAGDASYYYSIPRVAVRGQIVRAGQSLDVKGLAWLDREWGSGALGEGQQGWDWFALQLQDGSTLMFYALRKRDGTRDVHSAGTWVDGVGRVRPLATDEVQIDVSDYWVSPRGGRYPSRWRLRVPAVGLDVDIRPALANQELGTSPRYWEGAVDVRAAEGERNALGRGYVELVGYGE
jgi:predicted secreted hydrolase